MSLIRTQTALFCIAAISVHGVALAASVRVVSPDTQNVLSIDVGEDGVMYAITCGGQRVIDPTAIAITIDGKKLPGTLPISDTQTRWIDEAVKPVVPTIASTISTAVPSRPACSAHGRTC